MSRPALSPEAKDTIHAAGLTITAYVRAYFPDGRWRGDVCGCVDDRCMDGFHHDPQDTCGCLPYWISDMNRWSAK